MTPSSPDFPPTDTHPAEEVLEWALEHIPRLAVTASFGAESVVLLHMVSRVAPRPPVLFLDTGLHFPETISYRRRLARLFSLDVIDVRPAQSVDEQAARHGPSLYDTDTQLCCHLRKVAPLARALRPFGGWVTGIRRTQTSARRDTPVVQVEELAGRQRVKVAPLATWSDDDVHTYIDDHHLPRHPLCDHGFHSIGCMPCTVAVLPGQGARSGRWPGQRRSECGLHEHAHVDDNHDLPSSIPARN